MLRQLIRDVEEIKLAVTGDSSLGMEGLAKRVQKAESGIAEFKSWRNKLNLKVAYTAGAVSGLTFWCSEGIKAAVIAIFQHKP